ncbi:MAG: exonuclease domain-containing protein [Nanoarchaeota archaeon]|nr:exonuclease domain-containing protein [Nanoarchaeota archaeon]
MKFPKKYISIDVEASGEYPWDSSMISFGACIIDGKFDKTFYAELKPISKNYVLENFEVGASKLNILSKYNYNEFNPEEVLKILKDKGEKPKVSMLRFSYWIAENTLNYEPKLVADNNLFDGMFISYYLSKFYNKKNPFGHSSENSNSVFKGASRNINASIKDLGFRNTEKQHNALEDAVNQAKEFWTSLIHIGYKL